VASFPEAVCRLPGAGPRLCAMMGSEELEPICPTLPRAVVSGFRPWTCWRECCACVPRSWSGGESRVEKRLYRAPAVAGKTHAARALDRAVASAWWIRNGVALACLLPGSAPGPPYDALVDADFPQCKRLLWNPAASLAAPLSASSGGFCRADAPTDCPSSGGPARRSGAGATDGGLRRVPRRYWHYRQRDGSGWQPGCPEAMEIMHGVGCPMPSDPSDRVQPGMVAGGGLSRRLIEALFVAGLRSRRWVLHECCHACCLGWGTGLHHRLLCGAAWFSPGATLAPLAVIARQRLRWWGAWPWPSAWLLNPGGKACAMHASAHSGCHPHSGAECGVPVVTATQGGGSGEGGMAFSSPPATWAAWGGGPASAHLRFSSVQRSW